MNSLLVVVLIVLLVYLILSKHRRMCTILGVIMGAAIIFQIIHFIGGAI